MALKRIANTLGDDNLDEALKIKKELENNRNILKDIVIQLSIKTKEKAEAEENYRKAYSIALHYLKLENKYPATLIVDLAKGKCHKEIKERELVNLEYDLLLEKMRNVRLEINTLITLLSFEKEQMKLV